jgi:soluble lytic murein transglycosylase-like protein
MKNLCFLSMLLCISMMYAQKPKDWKESKEIKAIISKWESSAELPRGLGHCVAYCESRFNPRARSGVVAGYRSDGLFQEYRKFLYDSATGLGLITRFSDIPQAEYEWFNPEHSAEVGCNYLAYLIEYWHGSVYLGVLSYTLGTENLKNISKIEDIPKRCTDYADKVLLLLDSYDDSW